MQAVIAARRQSCDTFGLSSLSYGTSIGQTQGLGLGLTSTPQVDMGIFQFQPPASSSYTSMSNQASGSSSGSEQAHSRPQSMPNPQMNNLHGWPFPSDNTAFSAPLPSNDQMPWSLLSSTNDVSLWDAPRAVDPPPPNTAHSTQSAQTGLSYDSLLSYPIEAYNMNPSQAYHHSSHGTVPAAMHPEFSPYAKTITNEGQGLADDLMMHAEKYGHVQFAEKDISQSARDYL